MVEILQAVDGLRPGWRGDLSPNEEARLICSGFARAVSGAVPQLNSLQVSYFNLGRHALADGDLLPLESVGSRVSLAASGVAKTGAARLMYIDCTVAAGNITVYDNTAASGTVVIPTVALFQGRASMATQLSTGCYVVLSNAAARVELGFR